MLHKFNKFLSQQATTELVTIGLDPNHINYARTRFQEKNLIKHLLLPGNTAPWGLLNLYLHILALDQKNCYFYHMPWDMVTPNEFVLT